MNPFMVATLFQFEKSANCIKVKTVITGIMLSTENKAKTKMLVISNLSHIPADPLSSLLLLAAVS